MRIKEEELEAADGKEWRGYLVRERSYVGCCASFSIQMADICEELRERDRGQGAYPCSLPSFIDIYRIMVRSMGRRGPRAVLVICSLKDAQGRIPADKDLTERQMDLLCKLVTAVTQRGSVYTRYSASQLLLLLLGSSPEREDALMRQLEDLWKAGRDPEWEGAETELVCVSELVGEGSGSFGQVL